MASDRNIEDFTQNSEIMDESNMQERSADASQLDVSAVSMLDSTQGSITPGKAGKNKGKAKAKSTSPTDPNERRAVNFTNEEVDEIVKQGCLHWDIIHGNFSEMDQVTNKMKEACWKRIAEKISA